MIRVLLFAQLREHIGQGALTLDQEQITVTELKSLLEKNYGLPTQGVMTAINETYARDTDIVHEGDTVALIPPVSGG
ncbi:molybdopterin converting factor subunit 1 [Sporolactobacillus sp. THM7-4]|nr:molybdopterin converting factor subunit 1 [Sporolactobacillus sp. THM7-4]